MLLIRRGYDRRARGLWSATRWQTYRIMEAQVGTEGLRKARIGNPTDLLPFPWEKEEIHILTDDEANDLQDEMEAMNNILNIKSDG